MALTFHHLDKWAYANLDLVEESIQKGGKALVIISGASSSGKSYAAQYLKSLLEENGHHTISMSLDQYDIGLSGIVPNKANLNFFDNSLPNMDSIKEAIKKVIYDIDFDKKYDEDALKKIRIALNGLIEEDKMDRFIEALSIEWKRVNFDETTVYDLHEASLDIKELLSGGKVQEKMYSKRCHSRRKRSRLHHSGRHLCPRRFLHPGVQKSGYDQEFHRRKSKISLFTQGYTRHKDFQCQFSIYNKPILQIHCESLQFNHSSVKEQCRHRSQQ